MGSDYLPVFLLFVFCSLLWAKSLWGIYSQPPNTIYIVTLIHTIFWITYFWTDLHACFAGGLVLKAKSETTFFNFADAQNAEVPWERRGQRRVSLPRGDSRKPAKTSTTTSWTTARCLSWTRSQSRSQSIPPRPTMRQRLMALVWKTNEEENVSMDVKEAPPGLFSVSLYVVLQDLLCVWCALALACVASEVCCHKYFFCFNSVYISTFNYCVELHFQEGWVGWGCLKLIGMSVFLIVLACESSDVSTVCIWHCEHARVCVEVFMRHIYIFFFIHSKERTSWNFRRNSVSIGKTFLCKISKL